jgi:hypothetical protein
MEHNLEGFSEEGQEQKENNFTIKDMEENIEDIIENSKVYDKEIIQTLKQIQSKSNK